MTKSSTVILLLLQTLCFASVVIAAGDYLCNKQCNQTLEACSCQEGCKKQKNCCTDYEQSCNNGKSWLEEECTPDDEMVCPEGFESAPVIMFSMDGFRNSYLYRDITPNIWKLASCGVHSPYIRSVYPTKTFPNHYTIATGLYPESHGIVGNSFYDHEFAEEFKVGSKNSSDPYWWGGEPIWVTASNSGLKSASYFWVGSDVNITRYPDYYFNFDSSVPDEKRIYQVLDWLDLPKEERPSIIMVYIEGVDNAGHAQGPYGEQVNEALEKADVITGMLMDGLKARQLDKCVNLIILADHGMADMSCDRLSYIDEYGVDLSTVYFNGGSYGAIGKSKNPDEWGLFDSQEVKKKLQCKRLDAHFETYLKQQYMPKRYHYAFNKRIDDVQLVLDDEWIVGGRTGDSLAYCTTSKGTHGWDNEFKSMRAVFVAHGASFKRKYNTTEGFESIEIYNMVSGLLGIDPAPNNGTPASLNHLLKEPTPYFDESTGVEANKCPYPSESDLPTNRRGCSACLGEAENNQRLDNTPDQESAYQQRHLLYGVPEILILDGEDIKYCILSQQEYITGYDWNKKMPYFTTYILDNQPRDMKLWSFCARADIRVPGEYSTSCTDFDGTSNEAITAGFLYPAVLSTNHKSDALILSNAIPVYKPFVPIWQQLAKILHQWSIMFDGISVIVGPIFDYNNDGHADSTELISSHGSFVNGESSSPIPTHVFVIITKCKDPQDGQDIRACSSSPQNIEAMSFIIPNYQQLPCLYNERIDVWVPQTLTQHIARIRDVELLTGIQFFPNWSTKEGILQSTLVDGIRLRTHLPVFGSSWLEDLTPDEVPTPRPTIPITTTSNGHRLLLSKLICVIAIMFSIFEMSSF